MEVTRLPSGRLVTIRPIRPEDDRALREAHDRLSPESKYGRFLAAKPHLSAADARYLVQIDGANHVALVAAPAERPDLIIAVARFVRLSDDAQAAEFAIVVGDPFQQEGLGTLLMRHLADAAGGRGITRFRATMLAANTAAHRLVAGLPGRRVGERRAGSVDEVEIELCRRAQDEQALAA